MRALMRPELVRLAALLLASGCQNDESRPGRLRQPPRERVELSSWLGPPRSSRFVCTASECRQSSPRLPSAAEWRCAEEGGVVYCAGGEPAAGVVAGAADPAFRCGKRWDETSHEQLCLDRDPEYPSPGLSRCAFEQEHGIARVCRAGPRESAASLPARALPACWLDRDCPSGRCDRGACSCQRDADCRIGRCEERYCVEAVP